MAKDVSAGRKRPGRKKKAPLKEGAMSEPQETHMEDYFSTLGPKPRPEHGPKIAPDDCKADVPCPNAAALPAEPCVDATQPEQPSAPPRKAANK